MAYCTTPTSLLKYILNRDYAEEFLVQFYTTQSDITFRIY
jgi:hypothetical protein